MENINCKYNVIWLQLVFVQYLNLGNLYITASLTVGEKSALRFSVFVLNSLLKRFKKKFLSVHIQFYKPMELSLSTYTALLFFLFVLTFVFLCIS